MASKKSKKSEPTSDWVLPAAIPFEGLKGKDLEECVYWLLDSMGAKNLEWRTGGAGGGAADGGRDLEARFHMPTADGEIDAQKWWIECKGRSGTVEADAVKAAVNNTLAMDGLDSVVIATNTQFSNPTWDWVKEWQKTHPRPIVKLWDRAQLERYLSRQPGVVLRLFSDALSLEGRVKAMEDRLWNRLEFVAPKMLVDLWANRHETSITPMAIFAAIVNEFANGDIVARPWGGALNKPVLLLVLSSAFQNVSYLAIRCSDAGMDQGVIFRSLAYLLLVALDTLPTEQVSDLLMVSVTRGNKQMPDSVLEMLLEPILFQLQAEVQEVCVAKCNRVLSSERYALGKGRDEVDNYWVRLESVGVEVPTDQRRLVVEKLDEPCAVGLPVSLTVRCPLFSITPGIKTADQLLRVIKSVTAFRKLEAAKKREADQLKAEKREADGLEAKSKIAKKTRAKTLNGKNPSSNAL